MPATEPADPPVVHEPKPKRTKSPRYDVYRVDEGGSLTPLATDVSAPSREKAIEKQDDPWGTFATARTGELRIRTREKAVREEAVWK